ncbi:hypothetical protein [Microcystis sp. 49638_E5]|jgi:hypothetical protein|nr:hypothetical protein [Microcystis sp. 49638_E5]
MQPKKTDKVKKWTKFTGRTKAQRKEEEEMKNETEKRLAFFLSRV